MDNLTHAIPKRDFGTVDVAEIFKADYQRIYQYIISMVNDRAEAEDLAQETFLRAYDHRDALRDESAQTAWLYRIATYVALDRLRQYARRNPKEAETDLDLVDIAESDSPSLQKVIEQDEMSACVQGYLNRPLDTYRSVVLLHDMHDLTAAEIAGLLGGLLPTVKIRLHRARVKLRAALGIGCAFSFDERNVLICESKH